MHSMWHKTQVNVPLCMICSSNRESYSNVQIIPSSLSTIKSFVKQCWIFCKLAYARCRSRTIWSVRWMLLTVDTVDKNLSIDLNMKGWPHITINGPLNIPALIGCNLISTLLYVRRVLHHLLKRFTFYVLGNKIEFPFPIVFQIIEFCSYDHWWKRNIRCDCKIT